MSGGASCTRALIFQNLGQQGGRLDPGDGCFYCSRCWRDFELQAIENEGGMLVSEGEGGGVREQYGQVDPQGSPGPFPFPFPAKNSKNEGGREGGVFARFWEEAVEEGEVGGKGGGGDGGGDFSVVSYNVLGEYHGQKF
jgi:hypothetical protein